MRGIFFLSLVSQEYASSSSVFSSITFFVAVFCFLGFSKIGSTSFSNGMVSWDDRVILLDKVFFGVSTSASFDLPLMNLRVIGTLVGRLFKMDERMIFFSAVNWVSGHEK